ncbi:hypothetical protein Q5H93_09255 [Hymenobacter sp. ASUV-10]|uniref:T9SS type A sorting domain-containing protein n=1 Tax=Hymenobacter aranciens TaxID=3063996 RepID=A0ABT9BD11_9BACT|nr:hypothetical protein [Hymenobacter sp. ASUV-10]MDO7874917.1 hypothetical protein [Hymenobacter sp. ASUV-10]
MPSAAMRFHGIGANDARRSISNRILPSGTVNARLLRRSTDGRTVQRVALDAATTQQELSLRGYEPGVYFATLLVGGTAVQTIRILVK